MTCALLVACNPDPGGAGTEGESTGTTTGTDTSGTTMVPTTADTTMGSGSADSGSSTGTTTMADSTTASESSSTGCTPGQEGCTCDERDMCEDDLECIDDMCVLNLCGNGEMDDGEECDDGNPTNGDGCNTDCTISTGAEYIVAGDEHVCAALYTGEIKCWGNFTDGRLGYMGQAADVGDDETPADMGFVDTGAPVVQLALGSNFTCALLDTNEVKCWGDAQHGRLGQGNETDLGINETPANITAIDLGGTPEQIAAGAQHACAVLQDGTARCWGRNDQGQLGLPGAGDVGDDELPSAVPVVGVGNNVDAIAAGSDHTCALLGTGEVLCWGRDNIGQLGTPLDGNTDIDDPAMAVPVMLDQQVVLLAARYDHTCVAFVTGDIQCWGDGSSGKLGYGNTDTIGDDEEVNTQVPLDLGAGAPTHLGMGDAHTCVRLGTTQIYCWGEGNNGRLGYGNTDDLFEPAAMQVDLNLPQGPNSVTAGEAFTCGTTQDGRVKCWGANNRGQLGYGNAWTTDLGVNEPIDSVGEVMLQ